MADSSFWDALQWLRQSLGLTSNVTPPEYGERDKDRRERNAFHQRMRQFPKEDAQARAIEEARQMNDQYLARKELYRQTGDRRLLENAGGAGQPSVSPDETRSEGMFGRDLRGEPEFVRRMYDENPPTLDNGDSSFSTHGMASARVGNMEIAYPTVVNINGKLMRLPDDEALSYALRTGEYKRFPTQQDSDIYARGAWKDGTRGNE